MEISHFIRDIVVFGSADGFNSSTGERNLKFWAKKPSKTAQKRSDGIFLEQTAWTMSVSGTSEKHPATGGAKTANVIS